ncbi:MAG: bifunctional pyr operon transcriptional regulator/uracil phosphoribosyltransferase PyrR [Candidatus Coatesbacteria bacterium]|nr:MAG: bifunctional pyr operon transcriptional regulator/uracil phosphoribosyltransferase PyrR [Candidatus Coatesbacteria bacterium]
MSEKPLNVVLDADGAARAIKRIASEILERNEGPEGLAVVGIESGGVPLARGITAELGKNSAEIPIGTVDITLYRDDFSQISELPVIGETNISFPVDEHNIILVDDVLFTGRTVRAAIDNIYDLGRPRRIQLAVLADRGGRELPIQPDFLGNTVEVADDEYLDVVYDDDKVRVMVFKRE